MSADGHPAGPPAGFDGLPGEVAVSHLRVYDWPAGDGVCGGTPHLHLVCSEAYVVTGGRGAVQTLTASGYGVTPLAPGTVARFTPGTVHRLVDEGGLRITVLMQNGGLPEAGDAVLTLPPAYLADPRTYAAAALVRPRLASGGSGGGGAPGRPPRRRGSSSTGWSAGTCPTSPRPPYGPRSRRSAGSTACAGGSTCIAANSQSQ